MTHCLCLVNSLPQPVGIGRVQDDPLPRPREIGTMVGGYLESNWYRN